MSFLFIAGAAIVALATCGFFLAQQGSSTGWIIAGFIYFLGSIVFFKMAQDSRWLRAAIWPLFLISAIVFS